MRPKLTNQIIDAKIAAITSKIVRAGDYIDANTPCLFRCIICNHAWLTRARHIINGHGCPYCAGNETWNNQKLDEFITENKINLTRLGDYINNESKILFRCDRCGYTWNIRPHNIKDGNRCPQCFGNVKSSNKELDDFLTTSNAQIIRVEDYVNAKMPILFRCVICNNEWSAKPNNIKCGKGCPECSLLKNEKIVGQILKELGVKVSKLRIDLPSGQKLFPDFYLPCVNTIIEYNGLQHYEPVCFGNSMIDAVKRFEKQQDRDEKLREYCFNKNIILFEIDGRKYKNDKLKAYVLTLIKGA
jgi:hypothetical protein